MPLAAPIPCVLASGVVRAVVCDRPGDETVMRVADIPAPQPGANDLLIRVGSTALNRADLLQRRGLYPPPPSCPASKSRSVPDGCAPWWIVFCVSRTRLTPIA